MARTTLGLVEFAVNTRNSMEVRPLCLFGVEGHMGRLNDALFKPALPLRRNPDSDRKQKTLVFFGGDIQNFIHLMDQEDPRIKYNRWCLEAAAIRLGEDFPSHHIVVIKPTRIVCDHISCFDNFVEGNFVGMPRHLYHYNGLPHMEKLLKKISMKIKQMQSEELFKMLLKKQDEEDFLDDENPSDDVAWQYEMMSQEIRKSLFKWQKNLRLHKYPLTLVAFSKGCVVLNQFLYEFHYAKRLEPWNQDSSFVDRIEAMYWLDAGHPGKSNVYLTARALLKTLAELGIEIHLHVSLYQTEDFNRPWIRWQCKEFSDLLIQFKANVIPMRHDSWPIDLESHFDVLMSFKRLESERESCGRVELAPRPPPRASARAPFASASAAFTLAPAPRCAPALDHREVARREILGLSLISPHDTPYLGLRTILRRPFTAITQSLINPSASGALADSVENQAGPSTARIPSHLPAPPLLTRADARNFTVLLSKESLRIDFSEDLEAARALRAECHSAIEEPVIALPNARAEPGVHVYRPCNEMYAPVVMDTVRPPSEDSVDSSAAATPRPAEPAPGPPLDVPHNNIRIDIPPDDNIDEYSPSSGSPSSGSMSVASAPAILRTVQASTLQDTPRAAHANNPQGTPRAAYASTSQDTPRAAHTSTSQGTPRIAHANTSHGSPRAAQASASQGTPRAEHANNSQSTDRAANANTSPDTPRAEHAITSQGTPRADHANTVQGISRGTQANTLQDTPGAAQASTSQATPRVTHANASQGISRGTQANTLQDTPRLTQASTSQATPRVTHANASQGISRGTEANTLQDTPRLIQASTSQDTSRVTHANASQGISRGPQASTSQGTPRTAQASTPQGISRGPQASTSQGTPRTAQASTPQGISRGPQASTSQGMPRTAQASTPQGISRGPQASTSQGMPRTAQASTPQGISRGPQASTSQGTPRTAQASTPQGISRGPQASTSQGMPRTAQASTPQGISRGPQASTSQGTPRTAQASTPQGISRGTQASTSQGMPRTAQASTPQGISRGPQASTSQGMPRTVVGSRVYSSDSTAYLNDRSTATRYNLRSLRN